MTLIRNPQSAIRRSCLGLLLALTSAAQAADGDAVSLASRIDQRISAAWSADVKPAPVADDSEFFRRVHLDLAGRIPSVTEIRDFLEDDRPDKRRLWVDRILRADPDDSSYRDAYVNHFANVWRAWLLTQTNVQALLQQPALELWLRQKLASNAGYDRLVRDLLTQQPGPGNRLALNAPDASVSAFYQANEFLPENLAGSTSRLFLGVKLECAQCHDHPFAKWTREQFWQYAAFFTDLPQQNRPNQPPPSRLPRGEIKMMGSEKVVKARFLDGKEPKWKETGTRPTLVDWMTAGDNPFFARAAVNRIWTHFFGVALVDQSDGSSDEGPAMHQELLDELAHEFAASAFDVKFLIRALTNSQAYQRASAAPQPSQQDPRLFARSQLRGLSPEQLFDSLAMATEFTDTAPADPLAALRLGQQSPRSQFLSKFAAQEQKTDYQTSILQALYLMNNDFIADRTNVQKNRTLTTLAEQRTSTARKIESLFLVVLSRKPRGEESERFTRYVESGDAKQTLADVCWVLLNSPEFMLNH